MALAQMSRRPSLARRLPVVLLAAAGTAGLAAACGGGSSGQQSSAGGGSTPAPATAGTGSAGAAGTTVNVNESDFTITLPTMTFSPGTYTFMVKNSGPSIHALEINGPGVSNKKSDNLPSGESTTMSVALQKGTYELWCPVDAHKERGMDLRITVS